MNPIRPIPLGGAYTTPTLLFIPAGALPAWNVRVITAVDVQGPTPPDRLAVGNGSFGFGPSLGGENGAACRLYVGCRHVVGRGGHEPNAGERRDQSVSAGSLSHRRSRRRARLSTGDVSDLQVCRVSGDPGELEVAFSGQYRERSYEVGLQAVLGKDFATTDADGEIHAYALYRVIPQLGLGGAGQVRIGLVSQPGEITYDVVGGAMASLTMGVWQIAGLVGASTLGLNQGQVGGFGEAFATVRF